MVDREVAQPPEARFPFDITFQQALLRILLEDVGFATTMGRHIKPFFFENPVLAWAWNFAQRYQEKYGATPGFDVLLHQTKMMVSFWHLTLLWPALLWCWIPLPPTLL